MAKNNSEDNDNTTPSEKEPKKAERVQPVGMSDEDFKAKCELLDEYGKMKPQDRAKHFLIDPITKQLVRK